MAGMRLAPVVFLRAAPLHSFMAGKRNFMGTKHPFVLNIQANLISRQLSDLSFRRIRVATQQDINRLYPLLVAYIQNPALASTVTELVIDISTSGCRYYQDRDSTPVAAGPEKVAAHAQLEDHTRALGLGSDATTFMQHSLSWKFNPQLPPANPYSDPQHPPANKYYSHGIGDRPNSIRGFANVAATLLLSLCPNIQLLHMYELGYSPPLQDFLIRNNYGRLPAAHLRRLERVHLQSWDARDNREYDHLEFLDYFRFFGRLPALRTYSADCVAEFQPAREVAPPGSAHGVTRISIANADVSGDMLGTIIRVPRALEEFTLSLGGLTYNKGGTALVNPKTLGKCLLEQKGTLKSLDLDVAAIIGSHKEEAEEQMDDNDYGKDEYFRLDEQAGNGRPLRSFDLPNTRRYGLTIGSLHDFEALEHLAISVDLMLGPRVWHDGMMRRVIPPPFRLVDALPRTLK
ncbi:hypothetical protein V8F20_011948 [Naviculisporaceae sp. PSN 640]